ncbi:MAG: fatty acid desaturase [Blastocatellia bacterium]|nr:fatty acid desaturase [Blastocatellia bacterium]
MTELSHNDYIRRIRAELPPGAFSPAPRKLWIMFGHLALVVCAYCIFRFGPSVLVAFFLTLVIGHSLACLGFLTHELAHGAIVRSRPLRYALEVFFWGLNLIPATVWRRVHNQTHHIHANTPRDPDRPFLRSEESASTRWYTRLFFPNRRSLRWNPLVALHLVAYTTRNAVAAFYRPPAKPSVVPAVPGYSMRQRAMIVLELIGIVVIQAGVFLLVGRNWSAYLWASPIAYAVTSAVAMSYIFTNHFLNPISQTHDPLLGTTSVIVPSIIDRLHVHFSLHTEHHLFPSMNSDYYPLVASALRERFPDRYNRLPMLSAWKKLWRREVFSELENSATTPNEVVGMPSPQGGELN